jgi:hypothetical protein
VLTGLDESLKWRRMVIVMTGRTGAGILGQKIRLLTEELGASEAAM